MTPARIVVVDDHPMFRRGLRVALGLVPDLEVVADLGSVEEALVVAQATPLELAIVDVIMPDISGLSLVLRLRDAIPTCKVLCLSVVDEPGVVADLLRAGADGYACKADPVDEIVHAVHQVLGDVKYLSPRISRAAVRDAIDAVEAKATSPLVALTPREREVFELLIRGRANDSIATTLAISRRTVETHRQNLMNKLGAHTLVELQRLAARYGGLLS